MPVCSLTQRFNSVWQYDGSGTSWTQIGGPALALYGGGYGLVATDPSTGDPWLYGGTPNQWQHIGTPGTEFAVTGDTVFGLTPNSDSVWRYDGSGTSWTQIGGPAWKIYGGGYGLVAIDPSTGNLWRYLGTPNQWQEIGLPEANAETPLPGPAFAVTGDTVFGTTPAGVWQYDGSTTWTQIGGPALALYGGGYGLVATGWSGGLWRYLGTPNQWQQIGDTGAEFAVTGDTVFGLTSNSDSVWRYDGSGTSWTQVGNGASALVAIG